MKQHLREMLNRSSIYLAVTFPNTLTIALMCRLNNMPFRFSDVRDSMVLEGDEPLDVS